MSVSDEVVVAPSELFQGELKRDVGLRGLTLISLGSIIGSGWLLGALGAAQSAGPASLLSWILAGAILGLLALVHAELGAAYPLSGGTARFPFLGFGALGGFTGGWMAWIQAVTIAPIEVEAALTYLESTSLHPGWVHANGTLTGGGIVVAGIAMALFTFINIMGVRWLADSNSITMIWKLAVPTLTIIVLLIVSFNGSNFSAGGGFAPFGAKGIFAALPLGVVFALEGFEQAIQIGGESQRSPARHSPRGDHLDDHRNDHLPPVGGRVHRCARTEGHHAQLEQPDPGSGRVRPVRHARHGGRRRMARHDPLHRLDHLAGRHRPGLLGHLVATVLQPVAQRLRPSGARSGGQARRPIHIAHLLLGDRDAGVPAVPELGRDGGAASPRRPC